jgi:uncharacterized membrane protein
MSVLASVTLFDSQTNISNGWRFLHIVCGIAWIGLLYYFNFVQVPAFAEFKDASARNEAIDKVARKALWWFRWAAVATVITGLMISFFEKDFYGNDFGKRPDGLAISTGMFIAIIMFLNVWGVIWRNQKVVLANAATVIAGGAANPDAPAAGRRALLASRQNVMFSVSMVWFMTFASHLAEQYNNGEKVSGSKVGTYWMVTMVILAVLELSALGIIGGTKVGNITNWFYESVQNVLIGAFGLWAFFWIFWEILF